MRQGAASAVGAEYKVWRNEPANKNMITNQALSDVFNRNYEALGGGHMPHIDSTGSTDMGDVSHVRPPSIRGSAWTALICSSIPENSPI